MLAARAAAPLNSWHAWSCGCCHSLCGTTCCRACAVCCRQQRVRLPAGGVADVVVGWAVLCAAVAQLHTIHSPPCPPCVSGIPCSQGFAVAKAWVQVVVIQLGWATHPRWCACSVLVPGPVFSLGTAPWWRCPCRAAPVFHTNSSVGDGLGCVLQHVFAARLDGWGR